MYKLYSIRAHTKERGKRDKTGKRCSVTRMSAEEDWRREIGRTMNGPVPDATHVVGGRAGEFPDVDNNSPRDGVRAG